MSINFGGRWFIGFLSAVTAGSISAAIAYGSNATTILVNSQNIIGWFTGDKKGEPKIKVNSRVTWHTPFRPSSGFDNKKGGGSIQKPPKEFVVSTIHQITIWIENIDSITLRGVRLLGQSSIRTAEGKDYVPVVVIEKAKPYSFEIAKSVSFTKLASAMLDALIVESKKDLSSTLEELGRDSYFDLMPEGFTSFNACFDDESFKDDFVVRYYNHRITQYELVFDNESFNRYCMSGSAPFKSLDFKVSRAK